MAKRIREVRQAAILRANAFRCDVYQWHYSARTIVEYLRHHSAANDDSSDFKINDHHAPVLARLWTFLYPERAGFFELRGIVAGVAA